MAYVCVNKLDHHLTGTDVDKGDETISIDDRHEGNIEREKSNNIILCEYFLFKNQFLSKSSYSIIKM